MTGEEEVKGKVVRLLAAAKPRRRRARPAGVIQSAKGDHNIQAGRDVHIRTEKIDARPRVIVVPGVGVVDAGQKARLQALVKKWIALDAIVSRGRPSLSFPAAYGALNAKMRVSSYLELPIGKFQAAVKYLEQQIARLNRTPTARKRSTSWRADRIKAIQARSNERGFQDRRHTYMLDRFGAASMTELDDQNLGLLYSAVMGWS